MAKQAVRRLPLLQILTMLTMPLLVFLLTFVLPCALTGCSAIGAEVDPVFELLLMNPREQFVLRRNARLQQLPAAVPIPDLQGPAHNEIDRFIGAQWQAVNLPAASSPPKLCSDPTFLRRVYLDVIGRVPTLEETQDFLCDQDQDKRRRLIDALLDRVEEYADHWTPFWEEAIASNPSPIVGGIPSRGNHQSWLHAHFVNNTPYDVMVAELLDPRMPGHQASQLHNINGKPTQAGFILNQTHTDTIQTAAVVGQVFLGTGMKCASCHDHFENDEWGQLRFLAFAGLFGGADLAHIRCEKTIGGPVAAAFPFKIPGAPGHPPQGLNDRLHFAAFLLTDPLNPRFSRTVVNRLWRRYLGLGLFEPVDDFRLDVPASHPELLAWLARDFMVHGYDLKHTIRLILNSRTYQLAFDPSCEDRFDTTDRLAPRYFRSPTLRKLTAEQLVDSVRTVTQQHLSSQDRLYRVRASTPLSRSLSRPASRNEVSTLRSEDTAVVQALELLNGIEYHQLIYEPGALTSSTEGQDTDQQVQRLYLAILNREPTAAESRSVTTFLTDTATGSGSNLERMGDAMWALMTAVEFQYIH